MRTIERDIASAVLITQDGKIFLARKKAGGVYEGTWAIPGGGIDAGETKEDAMTREVHEETGIDVAHLSAELVDVGKGESEKTLKETGERVLVQMTFYDFRVMLKDDAAHIAVHLADEFDSYQWFAKDELATIAMSPGSENLFRKLGYLT